MLKLYLNFTVNFVALVLSNNSLSIYQIFSQFDTIQPTPYKIFKNVLNNPTKIPSYRS